jgi:hypothetical protein
MARWRLPVSLPQLTGLMQSVPGAALPVQSSPASAVSAGTGPLPGPAATTR